MRIAVFAEGLIPSSHYRAFEPVFELGRRGHRVWINAEDASPPADMTPDVALVSRYTHTAIRRVVKRLRDSGTGIVWDYDDAAYHSPHMRAGGLEAQNARAEMTAMLKLADVATTTNETLGEAFREMAPTRVHVIDNYLGPSFQSLKPRPHDGVVLCWAAMLDHNADWRALDLRPIVLRLLDAHPELRVESLGPIDLKLPAERYVRRPPMPIDELGAALTGFDLAIAPIADIPFNRARSSIKVKEYAAAGVPWLASPIGPYRGLGEQQGGRLVPDDRWEAELEELLSRPRLRRKLAKRAHRWARSQLLPHHVGRWETAFAEAIELASARGGAEQRVPMSR